MIVLTHLIILYSKVDEKSSSSVIECCGSLIKGCILQSGVHLPDKAIGVLEDRAAGLALRLRGRVMLARLIDLGVPSQSVKGVDLVTAVTALLLSQERLAQLAVDDVLLGRLSTYLDLVQGLLVLLSQLNP